MSDWTLNDSTVAPTLWLDANNSSTLDLVSGEISRWRDSNDLNICAISGDETARPVLEAASLNNLPGVRFYSGDKFFITDLTATNTKILGHPANYTIFVVAKKDTNYGYDICGISYDTNYYKWGTLTLLSTNQLRWVRSASTSRYNLGITASNSSLVLDNPFLSSLKYTSGDIEDIVRLNGAELDNVSVTGSWTTSYSINRGYYLAFSGQCTIYEFVVFNTSIAPDLVEKIEGYLAWKWGLQGDLSETHPYKTAPPTGPGPLFTFLYQPWSAKLSSNILQPWQPAETAVTTLSQPYNSARVAKSVLKEVWKDYGMLRGSLQHSWYSLSYASSMLKNVWSITSTAVSNQLNTIYNVKNTNTVTKNLQQQYWSTGSTNIETLQSQYVTVNSEIIYPSSVELKTSIDQYAITASIVLASIDELKKFVPGNTVTVHGVLDTTFTFIVDNYDYEMSFDTDSFKVDLISPSALLDSPYCVLISGDYVGMASEICETLAAPLTITWEILDWYIGDGVLSASEESPLSVIRKIANTVGGRVQSNPNGSISIISRYPKSCNTWQAQPTSYTVDYASTVISEQYSFEQAPGYNNFSIKNDSTSDTILRVVTEEIDTNSKQVKVYVYPDILPTITHSGNTTAVTINYSGYVSVTDEKQVEFVAGESSVEGPVFNISSYSWRYRDLGTLTFEPTGTIYSATKGDSLLDIEYSTGYYSYVVSTSVLENVQIIVEADI